MMDPVDILSKYNSEWVDKVLEMKAWKEKKEALEALIEDASCPKLKNGDYMNVIKLIKKLIVDANFVVSQVTIKTKVFRMLLRYAGCWPKDSERTLRCMQRK